MARFYLMEVDKLKETLGKEPDQYTPETYSALETVDKELVDGLDVLIKTVNANLEKYRFADAADSIYHFMWDQLASNYLESLKRLDDKARALAVLRYVFMGCLKLLHPFMPFITEELWASMPKNTNEPLIISSWPE